MSYLADETRYDRPEFYYRCGYSGLKLPRLSFGLWHNFGDITPFKVQQSMLRKAFDLGITHFDLANNYGPPYGEAEANFGIHMDKDWRPYRDELVISTKAGYDMWPGPYGGVGGSRKYLLSSLDQSLKRMHLDYVDIFYIHKFDPETPLEETMGALKSAIDAGKALYAGISNFPAEAAERAAEIMNGFGIHLLICQSRYNMFARDIENELLPVLKKEKVGCIAFQPLSGGILSDRYLSGIPADSRAGHDPRYLKPSMLTEEKMAKVRQLNDLAAQRGQSLSQMSLQWVLRKPEVTSALIGASRPEQIEANMKALTFAPITAEECAAIDVILRTE